MKFLKFIMFEKCEVDRSLDGAWERGLLHNLAKRTIAKLGNEQIQ